MNKTILSVPLLCLLFNTWQIGIKADLPITCTRDTTNYIGKTWTFHVQSQPTEVSLFSQLEVCTHSLPNSIQTLPSYQFSIPGETIYRVKVLDDESVQAGVCAPGASAATAGDCSAGSLSGKWSVVHRESLVVELSNGMRFVANLQYKPKNGGGM